MSDKRLAQAGCLVVLIIIVGALMVARSVGVI